MLIRTLLELIQMLKTFIKTAIIRNTRNTHNTRNTRNTHNTRNTRNK